MRVDQHPFAPGGPAEVGLEGLLRPRFPGIEDRELAGDRPLVDLLLRDLVDVAGDVGGEEPLGVDPLLDLPETHPGQFRGPDHEPRDLPLRQVGADQDGQERGRCLDLLQYPGDVDIVQGDEAREHIKHLLHVLDIVGNQAELVSLGVAGEQTPAGIVDPSPRRRDDPVVVFVAVRELAVLLAFDELQVVEPGCQPGHHDPLQAAENERPPAEDGVVLLVPLRDHRRSSKSEAKPMTRW